MFLCACMTQSAGGGGLGKENGALEHLLVDAARRLVEAEPELVAAPHLQAAACALFYACLGGNARLAVKVARVFQLRVAEAAGPPATAEVSDSNELCTDCTAAMDTDQTAVALGAQVESALVFLAYSFKRNYHTHHVKPFGSLFSMRLAYLFFLPSIPSFQPFCGITWHWKIYAVRVPGGGQRAGGRGAHDAGRSGAAVARGGPIAPLPGIAAAL